MSLYQNETVVNFLNGIATTQPTELGCNRVEVMASHASKLYHDLRQFLKLTSIIFEVLESNKSDKEKLEVIEKYSKQFFPNLKDYHYLRDQRQYQSE